MSQAGKYFDGTSAADVETLTGNSGGAVGADASFNINILGAGAISVAGNPGTNTLTISQSGVGVIWNVISANQTLAVDNSYICISPGGVLSLALPAVSAVGDEIEVTLDGATSFTITQPNAATRIRIANTQTTLGVGGTLASTAQGDTIRMVCQTANARWNVVSMIGSITVV